MMVAMSVAETASRRGIQGGLMSPLPDLPASKTSLQCRAPFTFSKVKTASNEGTWS